MSQPPMSRLLLGIAMVCLFVALVALMLGAGPGVRRKNPAT